MDNISAKQVPISKKEPSARAALIQALYKIGYCICIPDYREIDLNSQQVSSSGLALFLLQKNREGESILVRLLNLVLRNHTLTKKQSAHLFHLIYCLVQKLSSKQIGDLLNETHSGRLPVIYNFLYQLSMTRYLHRTEYQRQQLWRDNLNCINILQYFLAYADAVSLDRFVRDSPYSHFLLLKQLLQQLSKPDISQPCVTLFVLTAEKIIDHFPSLDFDKKMQERGRYEISFLCEQLFRGLGLLIQDVVSDEKKVPLFITLLTRILQKTRQETRQILAFEPHSAGCLLLLGCLILSDAQLARINSMSPPKDTGVNAWLNLIVTALNFVQIKEILRQGQQMIQEEKSITSTQKKGLTDKWHQRLTSYLGVVNQRGVNDLNHFALRSMTKNRDKKIIFFSEGLLKSRHIASPQDPIYSVDEQRPLLSHSNFFN